jgi:hypothetical protein
MGTASNNAVKIYPGMRTTQCPNDEQGGLAERMALSDAGKYMKAKLIQSHIFSAMSFGSLVNRAVILNAISTTKVMYYRMRYGRMNLVRFLV